MLDHRVAQLLSGLLRSRLPHTQRRLEVTASLRVRPMLRGSLEDRDEDEIQDQQQDGLHVTVLRDSSGSRSGTVKTSQSDHLETRDTRRFAPLST